MTDLTKITTPFGLLDGETQKALRDALMAGAKIELFNSGGWMYISDPMWRTEVAYRVKPVELTDMVVPWAAIKPEYKWAAMDKDGMVWLYKQETTHNETAWGSRGGGCEWGGVLNITPGTKPWDQSLVQRPEGV